MSVIVTASHTNTNIQLDPGPNQNLTRVVPLAEWRASDPASVVVHTVGGTPDIPAQQLRVFRAPTPGLYWLRARLVLRLRYENADPVPGGASLSLRSQSGSSGSSPVLLAHTRVLLTEVENDALAGEVTEGRDSVVEATTLAALEAGDLVYVTYTTNIKVTCPASTLNGFSAALMHGGLLPLVA